MTRKPPNTPRRAMRSTTATDSAGVGSKKYSESDIEEMERLALEKANKAMSAIENALAVWDAAKSKSEELKLRINRLKYFHDALSNWEKKMLMALAKRADAETRIAMLREFSDICYTYR